MTLGSSYSRSLYTSISYPCSDSNVAFQSAKGMWETQCLTPVTCSLLWSWKITKIVEMRSTWLNTSLIKLSQSKLLFDSEMYRLKCVVRKLDLAFSAVDLKFL